MAKVRRVDYSPDEYITGVGNVLRADEQGVYWMICSLIMSEGGPIARDERRLGGLCIMRPAGVRKIVDRLIELGKIALTDDGKMTQKRAQNEVKLAAKRMQIASENGAKGGRPARKDEQNQQNPEPGGLIPAKLSPSPIPVKERDTDVSPKKVARGSRLPADWELPNDWGRWACDEFGVQAAAVRMEAAKFRDYWIAKTGQQATKTDWLATWRNWCRTAFAKTGGRGLAAPSSRQPTAADIGRQLLEEMENARLGETSAGADYPPTRQLGAPLQREPS